MALLIRRVTDSDRDVAVRLLVAQLVEHHLEAEREGVERGVGLAMTAAESTWLLMAIRDERAVGIFLANEIVSVEKSGLVLWVEELYVIPAARRSGVAREILHHVAKEARRKGIRSIELEVVRTQAAAFGLYRAMGFKEVDRARMGLELG